MFSGKSTELLRRVRRSQRARVPVVLFKPALDTRSATVRSHDGLEVDAVAVATASQVLEAQRLIPPGGLVAVDEAQFLEGLVPVAQQLLLAGYSVVVAGLDLDYRGMPFGDMPVLLALADEVVKLSAVCVKCGRDATRTQRLVGGEPAGLGELVVIGGADSYEPRCLACWVNPADVKAGHEKRTAAGQNPAGSLRGQVTLPGCERGWRRGRRARWSPLPNAPPRRSAREPR